MSRIINIELKEFDADSLTGSFQNFGSALSSPAIKVQFFNDSGVRAYISKDGSSNFIKLPANGTVTLDESSFPPPDKGQEYYLPAGTQLEIKQVTGAGAAGTQIWAHIVTRNLP